MRVLVENCKKSQSGQRTNQNQIDKSPTAYMTQFVKKWRNYKTSEPNSSVFLKKFLHFSEMPNYSASLFTHFADLWKVMLKIINFVGKGPYSAAFKQFDEYLLVISQK